MKQNFAKITECFQTMFPDAVIEHITMLADSIIRYRQDLSKMTKKKPYKAKDIITILKHN